MDWSKARLFQRVTCFLFAALWSLSPRLSSSSSIIVLPSDAVRGCTDCSPELNRFPSVLESSDDDNSSAASGLPQCSRRFCQYRPISNVYAHFSGPKTPTARACQLRCASVARCLHYSWFGADSMCYLSDEKSSLMEIKEETSYCGEDCEGGSKFNLKSHLYGDPDAMIGTFMRIDIPILGFLDEFIFYTDVDVMFKGEVDWNTILEGADPDAIRKANDFASGQFQFSPPGKPGLPLYFSASSEMMKSENPFFMNAGVMLLNMRSLRDTVRFLFANSSRINYSDNAIDRRAALLSWISIELIE